MRTSKAVRGPATLQHIHNMRREKRKKNGKISESSKVERMLTTVSELASQPLLRTWSGKTQFQLWIQRKFGTPCFEVGYLPWHMQGMERSTYYLHVPKDNFTPCLNIRLGCEIISGCLGCIIHLPEWPSRSLCVLSRHYLFWVENCFITF